MTWMLTYGWLLYLVALGNYDLETGFIEKKMLLPGVAILALHLCITEINLLYMILSIILGLSFFLISKMTKEAMGYGDAVVIFMMCLFMGVNASLIILSVAFMLTFIIGFILMKKNYIGKGQGIPFLPFLSIANALYNLLVNL